MAMEGLNRNCHQCGHKLDYHAILSGCLEDGGECGCREGVVTNYEHMLENSLSLLGVLRAQEVASSDDLLALRAKANDFWSKLDDDFQQVVNERAESILEAVAREQEVGDSTETMGALRRLVSRLRSQGKIGGPEGGAFETLFLQAEAQLAASRKRVNETLTEYYRGTWPHYDSGYRCLECKQEWTDHRDDCVVPKVRRAALAEESE